MSPGKIPCETQQWGMLPAADQLRRMDEKIALVKEQMERLKRFVLEAQERLREPQEPGRPSNIYWRVQLNLNKDEFRRRVRELAELGRERAHRQGRLKQAAKQFYDCMRRWHMRRTRLSSRMSKLGIEGRVILRITERQRRVSTWGRVVGGIIMGAGIAAIIASNVAFPVIDPSDPLLISVLYLGYVKVGGHIGPGIVIMAGARLAFDAGYRFVTMIARADDLPKPLHAYDHPDIRVEALARNKWVMVKDFDE